jgi:hypothetical protein
MRIYIYFLVLVENLCDLLSKKEKKIKKDRFFRNLS